MESYFTGWKTAKHFLTFQMLALFEKGLFLC